MVATSTSSRHARIPCGYNHTIRISCNPQSFLLWILMDPWTQQNKAVFVPSFILLTRISPTKPLSRSCKLSDPYIYLYILCQILSFSEYVHKCFQDLLLAKKLSRLLVILFQYFLDQVCWILWGVCCVLLRDFKLDLQMKKLSVGPSLQLSMPVQLVPSYYTHLQKYLWQLNNLLKLVSAICCQIFIFY